jgi:hypothetical protein
MTYSLYSISANALSPSGCSSFTYALNGFKPYTRAPWYQFSEQQVDSFAANGGTNPAFPFMTGAGGWHQVGPMGWLGARLVEEQLIIQPALPPQISHASIRTIIFGGAGIKATMNYTHTTITRVDVSKYLTSNSSYPYANTTMPFTVGFSLESGQNRTISLGQTLVIENRRYFDNATTAGNIAQCLPVMSEGLYQPGQFPLAAIDGAASTRWQPSSREAESFTIDMGSVPYQPLTGVSFDWGRRPALSARVYFWNETSSTNASSSNSSTVSSQIVTLSNIGISSQYDPETNDIVQPYVGNMSSYAFSTPVWSGRYALLEISGCQATGDELGATVAEFNIFGANGSGLLSGASSSNSMTNGTATGASVTTVTPSATRGVPSSAATASVTGASPSGTIGPIASNEGEGLHARSIFAVVMALALSMMML